MAQSASRDLVVNLIGNTSQLTTAFSGASGTLSGMLSKAGGKGGLVGAVVAIGAGVAIGLEHIGSNFDQAYDDIRVATGATGDELESLTGSFDKVFASGPAGFDDVATAIGDLNSRLGLTGRPLEEVADNFLDVSRITGTDLSSNIEDVTRLFGDWGISSDDMVASMDELFRASQETGTPIDELASTMVKFGAPLRQLGFGFEESMALVGKFNAEGVNTDLVMGSMRIALGRLAKAGEPVQETFRRLVGGIKDAGSTSEANRLAVELFGARAGPDMAAAIREGRFAIDDYLGVIEDGSETIQTAVADTDDWRESWETLKNRTFVALKPFAISFFGALGDAMKVISEEGLGGAIVRGLQNLGAAVVSGSGELVRLGAQFGNWLLDGVQEFWNSTLQPWFRDLPGNIAEEIKNPAEVLFLKGWDFIRGLWQGARDFWFSSLVPFIKGIPDDIKKFVGDAFGVLKLKGWDLIRGLWQGARDFWFGTLVPFVRGIPADIKGFVGDLIGTLTAKGTALMSGFWNGIRDFWNNTIIPFFRNLPAGIKGWVGDLIGTLKSNGVSLMAGFITGVTERFTGLVLWLAGLPGRILAAVPNMGGVLSGAGRALGQGFVDAFEAVMNTLITIYNNTVARLPGVDTIGGGSGGFDNFAGGDFGSVNPKVKMHSGGVVPGHAGEESWRLLEAGETVLPAGWYDTGGGPMYVTVNMPPGSNGDDVVRALRRYQRRNGPVPLVVR